MAASLPFLAMGTAAAVFTAGIAFEASELRRAALSWRCFLKNRPLNELKKPKFTWIWRDLFRQGLLGLGRAYVPRVWLFHRRPAALQNRKLSSSWPQQNTERLLYLFIKIFTKIGKFPHFSLQVWGWKTGVNFILPPLGLVWKPISPSTRDKCRLEFRKEASNIYSTVFWRYLEGNLKRSKKHQIFGEINQIFAILGYFQWENVFLECLKF